MLRSLTIGVVVGCVLSTASLARAQMKQEFGDVGESIVSADRLVPLLSWSHWSQDQAPPPGALSQTQSGDQTSFSILFGSTTDAKDVFYTVPRVGYDYVLAHHITVGGDMVLLFTTGSTTLETDRPGTSTTTTTSSPGITGFGIAPRGGYILPLSDMFSLWLRGGLSFYTFNFSSTVGDTKTTGGQEQWALDLEPEIVATLIPHVGFTGALDIDIPFGGSSSASTTAGGVTNTFSAFSSVAYVGATVGMLTYF
jgi:hypothetical protein